MPTFEHFQQSQTIKMLFMGHTGAGKTGAVVSLAAAGYKVRLLDLDKGVEILKDFVMNPESPYRHSSDRASSVLSGWLPIKGLWTEEQGQTVEKRISYVALDETMKVVKFPTGTRLVPTGDLAGKIVSQFDKWSDGAEDLGSILDWGPEVVLVIDGLSRFSDALFNFQLKLGGRLISKPEQSDYNIAQLELQRQLMLLYSDAIKCHVVMICHIAFMETDQGPTRGFPQSIGKALGPKMGQFFNHALLAESVNQGGKRVVKTSTGGLVELKSAAPMRVKGEYNLSTALAEYFLAVRGPAPSAEPK